MLDLDSIQNEIDEVDVISHIESVVKKTFESNPQKLFNFLYRFDLPEEHVLYHLSSKRYKEVAELIWKRQVAKMKNWKES